jgi:hypothetical protein
VKSWTILSSTPLLAGLLLATSALAQPAPASCSASLVSPLQALIGTWTFSMDGSIPPAQAFASAGQFVASIGTDQRGHLTITTTSSQQMTTLETDAGTYQVFPDCSGGTLTFNLSTRPLQFNFWFSGAGEIRFVSTTSGATILGTAEGSRTLATRLTDEIGFCVDTAQDLAGLARCVRTVTCNLRPDFPGCLQAN